jgi:hypothetical protein
VKKTLIGAGLVILVTGPLVPTGCYVVVGVWRGEHFYKGRPTSYWRDVLLEDQRQHAWPFSLFGQARSLANQGSGLLGIGGRTPPAPHVYNLNFRQFVESFPGECPRLAVFGRNPAAAQVLLDLLSDTDIDVRKQACHALGLTKPPSAQAVPALAQALEDGDPFVRWTAAWALGQYGTVAQPAVPALVRRAKDRTRVDRLFTDLGSPPNLAVDDFLDWPAREAAVEALKRLDPEAARRAAE